MGHKMSVFVHAGGGVKNGKNCTLLPHHLPRFWLHSFRHGKGPFNNYVDKMRGGVKNVCFCRLSGYKNCCNVAIYMMVENILVVLDQFAILELKLGLKS